jgi:predicted aconitase with swiveling domain
MLNKNGTAPEALIVQRPDTGPVTGAIIMEIPLVDRLDESFYKRVEDRDCLKLDAEKGMIRLFKK